MSLKKGTKIDRGYATVVGDEGDNYRDIADVMTTLGHRMNHSSARNHVLRVMQKFAHAFADALGVPADPASIAAMARSPSFQSGVCDLLQQVEARRRQQAQSEPCHAD